MHVSKHLGEIFLWQLLGIVVVLGFLVWLLKRYLKKTGFSVVPSLTYKPINLLKTLFTGPELRNRLLLTVGIMIVVQLLGYVPLLGINYNEMLYSIGESGSGSKLNFFLFRSPFRIFSLGMGPFIAACLLIQSGSVIIPPLRRYMFSEGRDRFKLEKYTLILTGIISISHSVTVSRYIVNFPEYQQLITIPIPLFFLLSVLFLTGAVFVMIYMAVLISRYGIGNGFGMIILMGIFVKIFYNTKKGLGHAEFLSVYSPGVLILMCAAVVVILYCVYYVTSREHRISLSHKEHMDIKIPISFTVTGLIPKSIAMSLVIFIITLIPGLREWRIIYYLLLAIALFFCMYVYMFIVLNPQYIAQMAKKYGYSLQDGDPEALKQSI
ncbi:hypothetical protein ACFL6F_04160, partial [Planctomycetota bacterium]